MDGVACLRQVMFAPIRPHLKRLDTVLLALACALLLAATLAVPAGAASGGTAPGASAPTEATGAPAPAVPSAQQARLRRSLRSLMRRAARASGAYVYDITSGSIVFSHRAGTPRILASNTKLFTTAATLDRYGAGGRFATTLWGVGSQGADGTWTGDIYLRGAGDPVFGSESVVKRYYGGGASVETLARVLEERGIARITGRILGDATLWDEKRGTAAYGFRMSGEIGGSLSALAFNRGPWSTGESPARYAAAKLRNALRGEGIRVDGKAAVAAVPDGATQLASASSPTVGRLIAYTNKPSDNYLAEMLMKALAANRSPASTSSGAATAKRFAATLGSRVQLADGSGLSRLNRAAPREVVDLLAGIRQRNDYSTFLSSLAVPGVDGTLAGRMRGSADAKRCAGKTGTLRDVSALSGYCTTRAGHLLAFSLLMNNTSPPGARAIQDKIVLRLAKSR